MGFTRSSERSSKMRFLTASQSWDGVSFCDCDEVCWRSSLRPRLIIFGHLLHGASSSSHGESDFFLSAEGQGHEALKEQNRVPLPFPARKSFFEFFCSRRGLSFLSSTPARNSRRGGPF